MTHRIWFEREILPDVAPELGEVITLGPGTPSDGFSGVETAEGAIAGSLTYDRAFMDRAPDLRVIARTGIGVDTVDIDEATRRGIAVCNAPDAPTVSTAEHTVALILGAAKHLKRSERRLQAGEDELYGHHEAIELDGKVLGLVGYGRIARRVGHAMAAMGMHVETYDPYLADLPADVGRRASLEELLGEADVVSVHIPLSDATRHSFDSRAFAAMKPGAVFVNTARGGLVDHDALISALDDGHVFAAGLDVTDPEPLPVDHPLLRRDDVLVTPHIASGTRAGKRRLLRTAIEQVIYVLDGERPPHLVNPEVWGSATTHEEHR